MKTNISLCITLFFVLLSFSGQSNALEETNYCYKPSKPLFFSTARTKNRYAEDLQEYQRCQQSFSEMQERAAQMKKEAEMNSRLIRDSYMNKNN